MEFMNKKEPGMLEGFEPIRSAKDKRANATEIRKLIKIAGGHSFRGGAGFLEASIEDIRNKGGRMYGRCAMHPEAPLGVKTYGLKVPRTVPCDKGYPGAEKWCDGTYHRKLTEAEKKEARKELKDVKYLIGNNMNGSTIGKCVTAAAFLKLGIRCQLVSNGSLLVDNWPDYDQCNNAQKAFCKKYHTYGCVS